MKTTVNQRLREDNQRIATVLAIAVHQLGGEMTVTDGDYAKVIGARLVQDGTRLTLTRPEEKAEVTASTAS